MIAVALRGLWGRKLRATLTAIAIVLGVATVTGTYILTDSISNAFDSIFTGIYRGTDAAITGRSAITSSTSNTELPSFDESLLQKVRRQPEVAAAVGGVGGEAQLIGRNGKVIAFGGAPNLGFSVDPSQPQFNSLTLVDGDWPGSGEVVVDRSTAGKKDIKVGSMIRVEAQGRALPLRVSGLVNFGAAASIGGATLAGFDLPTAQRLFKKVGKLDQIRVASKPGVSEQQLVSQIRTILPPQTQVRTGEAQAESDASDTKSFLNILQSFLLAFGGIALFVGAFVIANSISITVAQRTREFATLRTIGASRRQVRISVLIEAAVVGILASVVGILVGLGLAKGLFWLFDSLGFTLPNSGLLLQTRTVIVALVVGIGVTILASLRPAFRATRVPPIAAVREGVELPPGRFARYRGVGSITLAVVGFALLAYGLFGPGLSTNAVLLFMGLGTLLIFFGVALFSSHLVVPLAHVLGAPGARFGGAPGELARENTQRNPQRTGSTAAALMIGLALVTLVAMLAAGIRSTFFDAVDKLWQTDYAVTAENNFSPIPVSVSAPIRKVPGVTALVGVRTGEARILGGKRELSAVDPGGSRIFTLDWSQGSQAVFDSLGTTGAFVEKSFADNHDLKVGSTVSVLVPTGERKVVPGGRRLRSARRGLSLRSSHDRQRRLRPPLPAASEPVRVPEHRGRRDGGQHAEARPRAGELPECKGAGPGRVQDEPGGGHQPDPERPLRPARPVGDREPVRHRQHARADGLRADPRAGHAPGGRNDSNPGSVDDPLREHDHGSHRRRNRHRARDRARGAADRARR